MFDWHWILELILLGCDSMLIKCLSHSVISSFTLDKCFLGHCVKHSVTSLQHHGPLRSDVLLIPPDLFVLLRHTQALLYRSYNCERSHGERRGIFAAGGVEELIPILTWVNLQASFSALPHAVYTVRAPGCQERLPPEPKCYELASELAATKGKDVQMCRVAVRLYRLKMDKEIDSLQL